MSMVSYVSARCRHTPERCWLWTMATSASTNGVHYPIARLEGRPQKVRTVMLRNKLGLRKLPRTIRVKATCGHSLCCNPDHLEPARMRMIAVMASYS